MSLVWTIVSFVLLLELVVLSLFVLPFPWGMRKNLARTFRRPRVRAATDSSLRYLGAGLVLAVAESVHALYRLDARFRELQLAVDAEDASVVSAKVLAMHDFRFRRACGQRNLYLASFCLVIALVLQRLVGLVTNEMNLRDKIKEGNGGKKIDEQGNAIADKKRD